MRADLSYADLTLTTLEGSVLYYTDLKKVKYFPKFDTLPDITTLMFAENFEIMKYYDENIGAPALRELRAAYQKAGIRPMERLITKMIKIEDENANWEKGGWERLESMIDIVLYRWTSDYGLESQRPLLILIGLIFIFGFMYWISMRFNRFGEVKVVWPSINPTKEMNYYKTVKLHKAITCKNIWQKEWRLMRVAFHLSLLSAFHVGWHRWDIGMWIRQLQIQEYELVVTKGWLRRLCGLQSLISVYLVALWAVTQFGNPFE